MPIRLERAPADSSWRKRSVLAYSLHNFRATTSDKTDKPPHSTALPPTKSIQEIFRIFPGDAERTCISVTYRLGVSGPAHAPALRALGLRVEDAGASAERRHGDRCEVNGSYAF
eukprot:5467085-Pleurochrysis_carterae.AAC.2